MQIGSCTTKGRYLTENMLGKIKLIVTWAPPVSRIRPSNCPGSQKSWQHSRQRQERSSRHPCRKRHPGSGIVPGQLCPTSVWNIEVRSSGDANMLMNKCFPTCMVTSLSSTVTSLVRKSAPIVALYWLLNFLLTYWFMSDVFPTLPLQKNVGQCTVSFRSMHQSSVSERGRGALHSLVRPHPPRVRGPFNHETEQHWFFPNLVPRSAILNEKRPCPSSVRTFVHGDTQSINGALVQDLSPPTKGPPGGTQGFPPNAFTGSSQNRAW